MTIKQKTKVITGLVFLQEIADNLVNYHEREKARYQIQSHNLSKQIVKLCNSTTEKKGDKKN